MADEKVAVEPKAWYSSVTVWTNVGAVLPAIFAIIDGYIASTKLIGDESRAEIALAMLTISGITNILLRVFATKQPIEGTPAAQGARRTRTTTEVSGPG